ncbi:hypothetical protein HU200_002222 [Digitaria exilis]|uniref:Transcription elongation factor SPT5 n=1 Tax=Digitaria exilis TaxID=1010633 RepID=A0A835KZK5_9POAL|nr:hypothetical protein HU200_002222 [Digitaria exilis]
MPHPSSMVEDDEEAVEEYVRGLQERSRYGTTCHSDYDAEVTEVEQQALLPSVKDPKLWMVKCAVGHERETAVCLMQKFIDRPDLQIKTVVALEHLKNFIYIEAEKEAHVIEACKGLRNIIASAKITLVPIREMADVLSVESKSVDLSRDSWVRMKLGVYKGDLAKVVDVDNVRQKVTVKLIPRIDLQVLANKLEGKEVVKKSFVTPQRFFSVDEAREMHIRVDRRRNRDSGEYFDVVGSSMFKDGFLYKTFSVKSISTQNIKPSFEELEKFKRPGDDLNEDVASLSTLFSDRKKGHFMKGDAVIVIKGDLKNLKGSVEKIHVFADHVVESSEILMGVPDRPELVLVKLREVKCKIGRRTSAKDRSDNIVSTKDVVRVVEGACKGKQGPVEHIHRGILFIYDRHYLEHSGFICAKSQSCLLVGGSTGNHHGNLVEDLEGEVAAEEGMMQWKTVLYSNMAENLNFQDGSCRVALGSLGDGDELIATANELEVVRPRRNEKLKIMNGAMRGFTGKLIGVDGSDGIVRVEGASDVKIVDMAILGKMVA